MADEAERERRWWQTLPGALTALAGLITAITGLIVALNQLGVWGADSESPRSGVAATSAAAGTTESEPPPAGGATAYRVSFPQGSKATLGEAVYQVLDTRVEQRNPGELTLGLTIRMTNNNDFDDNFWSSSFRLLVDGLARAPVDSLNELVAGRSSAEGAVSFAVPEAARTLVLQLSHVGEEVRLPVEVRPNPD